MVMSDNQVKISEFAKEVAGRCIFITGSARSGTSLVGALIHSMEGVEYIYEPPMVLGLLSMINDLDSEKWKLLFETYIYEEFLINSIAGRNFNFNVNDYSYIGNHKTQAEIEFRKSKSWGKDDCEKIAKNKIVAFKNPDLVYATTKFKEYYPDSKVVLVLRNGIDTINSILAKKWFSIENETSNLYWPFRIYQGKKIPHFVNPEEIELWLQMKEIDRAAFYYIKISEQQLLIPDAIRVKYSDLIKSPMKEVEILAENLALQTSPITKIIVSQIKLSCAFRDRDIVNKISKFLRDEFELYSRLSD